MGMQTELFHLPTGGAIPNNKLAVVLERGVRAVADGPSACEQLFLGNEWGGAWRNGVFSFHHFHSTSHEVLGVVRGTATLTLGGPQGQQLEVTTGDVVVLPAGTGHKRDLASPDFLVIGAYPPGQEHYDLRRGDPGELERALSNISAVALPRRDPVGGSAGPLIEAWDIES